MQNPILTVFLNQVRNSNPQAFQMFEQMRNGNGNPIDIIRQITSKFSPEQMNGLLSQAKSMGVPEEALNKIQNGINS